MRLPLSTSSAIILAFAYFFLSATASASTSDLSVFSRKALDEHNKYHSLHGAQPLVWEEKLVESAWSYAKECNFGPDEPLLDKLKLGENLYISGTSKDTAGKLPDNEKDPTEEIKAWYEEYKKYKDGMLFTTEIGHFTQVVWKATNKVGCVMLRCEQLKDKQTGALVWNDWAAEFLVCQYEPRGNFEGKFQENVQAKPNTK